MQQEVTTLGVATPLLEECENDTHTPEMGTWKSSETPQTSEFDCRGQNTSPWEVWTLAVQIMAKRRVKSQTGYLTLDH
jgi:hypothetical protein